MTEIEEKFYKTFDIKPKWKDKRVKYAKTYYTEEQAKYLRRTTKNRNIQLVYPPITDKILLELICILTKYKKLELELASSLQIDSYDIENLKYEILDITFWTLWFMQNDDRKERFKNEIRALFEEGAEDE